MDKSQKNRIFFLSLTLIWFAMTGFALCSGNIFVILITITLTGILIWFQIDRYKEQRKHELEYYPDSFPLCKKTDIELFAEFLNENYSDKNFLREEFRYSFIITKDGKISFPRVIKKPKKIETNEVIGVIQKLKDWTPATKNGSNVNFKFSGGFDLTVDRNMKIVLIPFNDSLKIIRRD